MELLGVFALCYIGGLSCCMPMDAKTGLTTDPVGVNGPLAHMLALMVMIYVGAATSGAHYNPAVTLALLVTGKHKFVDSLLYIAFQFAGGLCAGFMVWFICMTHEDKIHNLGYITTYPQITVPTGQGYFGSRFWCSFICEFIATFFLVFMVFGTAVDESNVKKGGFGSAYGVCIGGVVGFSALGIGKWSGAALNPARWLGPWIVSLMAVTASQKEAANDNGFGFIVYLAATCGGGIVAGITYKALFLGKD